MKVSVAQSCPTLCGPMDCSPPGSSVHGILQARILEWVAIPFPGDIPNPGMEPGSPALQVDSLPSAPPWKLKLAQMSDSLQAGRRQVLQVFRSLEASRIVPLKSLRNYRETWRLMQRA